MPAVLRAGRRFGPSSRWAPGRSRDGDEWGSSGQKVWSSFAHWPTSASCWPGPIRRRPSASGITKFILGMHAAGCRRPSLRDVAGESDFNEVFLDGVRVPDSQRVGATWTPDGRVANATLSGERQMVVGLGLGRRRPDRRRRGRSADRAGPTSVPPTPAGTAGTIPVRAPGRSWRVVSEERIRDWTNQRVRAGLDGRALPGPESSVGKVHQGDLNQRIQIAGGGPAGCRGDRPGSTREVHDERPGHARWVQRETCPTR